MKGGGFVSNQKTEELISGAELARRLGVSRSAINRYVDAGLLEPAERGYQGLKPQPKYKASDVQRLMAIRENRESGQDEIV